MNWLLQFLFPRRLHRLAYFLRLVAANIAAGFFYYYTGTTSDPGYWALADITLFLYAMFFILLPRIRDIGMSKWWLLITFIPFVNDIFGIILLFRAAPILRSPTPAKAIGRSA